MNEPNIPIIDHPPTPVMMGKSGAVAVSDLKKQYSKAQLHRENYVQNNTRNKGALSRTVDPTQYDTYEF